MMNPEIFSFLFVLIVALAGGWLKRIIGGGWPVIPWGIPRLVFGVPFAGLLAGLPGHWMLPWLSYALSDYGVRIGHAQYQNLGFDRPGHDRSTVDWLVTLFFGPDTNAGKPASYLRCIFGLSITGLGVTLGPGILYGLYVDPVAGYLLTAVGAFKPMGYMLGWALWNRGIKPRPWLTPNIYGEFWTGFIMWGAVAWIA